MEQFRVALRGRGRVELAAYGIADAEHQVEKELRRAWPGAVVEVLEVSRAGGGRIVEEFAVRYRVSGVVELEAASADEARKHALRDLRTRLEGTRHARIEWEREPEKR